MNYRLYFALGLFEWKDILPLPSKSDQAEY